MGSQKTAALLRSESMKRFINVLNYSKSSLLWSCLCCAILPYMMTRDFFSLSLLCVRHTISDRPQIKWTQCVWNLQFRCNCLRFIVTSSDGMHKMRQLTYLRWLFHMLNTIKARATKMPQPATVLMQTNSESDTVRKTCRTIVRSCGIWNRMGKTMLTINRLDWKIDYIFTQDTFGNDCERLNGRMWPTAQHCNYPIWHMVLNSPSTGSRYMHTCCERCNECQCIGDKPLVKPNRPYGRLILSGFGKWRSTCTEYRTVYRQHANLSATLKFTINAFWMR